MIRRIGLALLLCTVSSLGQQRPLQTEDPDTLPAGSVRLQFGFEFLQDAEFALSGLKGDLTRIGVLGAHVGLAPRVEFQVTGTLQNFLNVERQAKAFVVPAFSGNDTSDVGDFSLWTKIKLFEEKPTSPSVGFRFGAKLPNANVRNGLASDETDFFALLIFGKHLGPVHTFANLGLAILGDPVSRSSQDDQTVYGIAAMLPLGSRWTALAELQGRKGPSGPGTPDLGQARFGAQFRAAGLRWDFAGIVGYEDQEPNSGFALGVTYDWSLFGVK
ncbi:MAG: hypothetical protein HY652_14610 [Acidobacteria bacterium]|nr:hypothetical protein [Acidobacteriota bacterium]